jgi:hypothetical protein
MLYGAGIYCYPLFEIHFKKFEYEIGLLAIVNIVEVLQFAQSCRCDSFISIILYFF